jgi:hypothetical protein
MPRGTIHIDGISDQHGMIAFETENIYGSGGPDFPLLSIRTEIALKPFLEWRKEQKTLYALSLIRASGQLHSPPHRAVARFQQDIAHAAYDAAATTQVTFEIPLDLVTLSRIEKERAGADLQIRLAKTQTSRSGART